MGNLRESTNRSEVNQGMGMDGGLSVSILVFGKSSRPAQRS
jgi:hypothetical protein